MGNDDSYLTIGGFRIGGAGSPRGRLVRIPILLLALVALVLRGGCGARPTALVGPPLTAGQEVTFFVTADTHLGAEGIERVNREQIEAMNALPGTPWPVDIWGSVAEPSAVIVAGDLTDHGLATQWNRFKALYGRDGGDGLLRWPVKILSGNHDRHVPLIQPVVRAVARRHGSRRYSWNWGDVHLAALDDYPDAAGRTWLAKDLAAAGRRRPVVLLLHYSITGPYSNFWDEADKLAFAETISGYNVIAIFHGHYHASQLLRWRGYDVFNVGSPRHAAHSFAAVQVTQTHLHVGSWNYDLSAWQWRFVKRIRR